MTMAVGFLCSDGVVVAADRQVTGQNFTFPECKVSSVSWGNGQGILAYSGDHDTYSEFTRELWSRFPNTATLEPRDIRKLLNEALGASLKKKEVFQTLFGFWNDSAYQSLLMSNGTDRIVDVRECEVIGYGDSPLARFLLGRLTDLPFSVTVSQARIYSTYFISQVKKYDGQFVGGGIDIYSIDNSGDAGQKCTRIMDAGSSDEREREINLFQYKTDVLFHRLTDLTSDLNYEFAVNEFVQCMERFRNWTGKK